MTDLTVDALQAAFRPPSELTVGLEEELMVLDPGTLDLAPRAGELLADLGGDPRFKPELPAAQLEIVTPPHPTVGAAAADLGRGRVDLAAAAAGRLALAGAGAHPFAAAEGELNAAQRYAPTRSEYGPIARRQLVFGLHVHVALRGPARALAVHDALRSHLPELAALAANAPFRGGRDSGLASVRPKVSELLPRQGVPPAYGSWAELAGALRWGAAAGVLPTVRQWWWELRLHPALGTLELRVPDTQATVADAAAIAAVFHALVATLAGRHDAGEALPVAPTWRIEENRWSACRHGMDGSMADLETGEPRPTRERVGALLDSLEPAAARLGCAGELAAARELAQRNGAARQRAAANGDPRRAIAWLAGCFLDGAAG